MNDLVRSQEPLAAHTTFQIGGTAEYFATATTVAEVQAISAYAREKKLPVTVLGGGSNVLVSDDGVKGCVLYNQITSYAAAEADNAVLVTAGAGMAFDTLAATTAETGWWGLENLSHIPGSVGATPIQNVGAYGVEVADVIESVATVNLDTGATRVFSNEECGFGYRDSWFKTAAGRREVVTAVTFKLSAVINPQLQYADLNTRLGARVDLTPHDVRTEIIAIRSTKFPDWRQVGTAGSFFKNPIISTEHFLHLQSEYPELPGWLTATDAVKVPLGWILDKVCGLRGYTHERVGTYQGQALVVVNHGGATAAEVTLFAADIAAQVQEKTGITIEWEVTKLG